MWLNYTASNLLASLIYSAAWYYIDFDDLTIENFWNGFTAHFFKVILVLLYVFTFYVIREISNVAMNDGSHIFSIFMLVLANQMLYYIYDVFINKDNGMFYNIGYYLINSD